MKFYLLFLLVLLLSANIAFPGDGTMEGAVSNIVGAENQPVVSVNPTDEVYSLTPFESVSISASQVWQDNRHRAYYSSGTGNVNGFLLFDISQIPDNSLIVSMTLRCYLENAFGSPSNNPVVDVYWSNDDNWTRNTATANSLSLNDLLVDNIPFSTYTTYYDFQINVANHNWLIDLQDNRICFGFKDDVTYYSYVYFFGAYGTPAGPAPQLTIVTSTGTPQNVDITLTPLNPPIVIPATGGTFFYTVNIVNNETVPTSFNAWLKAMLPTGTIISPLLLRTLTLPAGGTLVRSMSQTVPGSAPSGNYNYIGCVGIYPSTVWDSSYFEFTKSALDGGKSPVRNNWEISGWDNLVDEITSPETPVLFQAYPNPFNASVALRFEMREARFGDLVIYDVYGREVASLIDGYLSPGEHQIEWDAEGLPSGIYFARLSTSETNSVMKLLMIK